MNEETKDISLTEPNPINHLLQIQFLQVLEYHLMINLMDYLISKQIIFKLVYQETLLTSNTLVG